MTFYCLNREDSRKKISIFTASFSLPPMPLASLSRTCQFDLLKISGIERIIDGMKCNISRSKELFTYGFARGLTQELILKNFSRRVFPNMTYTCLYFPAFSGSSRYLLALANHQCKHILFPASCLRMILLHKIS